MEKIAIIGTGISGMGAGYLLRNEYDITFYEKNDYPGGHTNTLTVDEDGKDIYVDSGFMVFNKKTYPNIIRLFDELKVDEIKTTMSFSVQHIPTGLEWSGDGLNGLFAQRKNIFSLRFWNLLKQMYKFNHEASEVLDNEMFDSYTMQRYVDEKGYGEDFLYKYLMPMCAAIWSADPARILEFPVTTLVRFFKNHGFLGFLTHFQWYTLKGGSRTYRDKILDHFKGKVHLNIPITKISKVGNGVEITDNSGNSTVYDKVIVACHSDQALKILDKPTDLEYNLLSKVRYQHNKATLHNDADVMPKIKRAWASWNYRVDQGQDKNISPGNIYYMNKLQKVSERRDYFVSIDDKGLIRKDKILREIEYEHPLFDLESMKAQKDFHKLNESGPIYFCGAYFKYGFHEDGFTAGINVAKRIAGDDIW